MSVNEIALAADQPTRAAKRRASGGVGVVPQVARLIADSAKAIDKHPIPIAHRDQVRGLDRGGGAAGTLAGSAASGER
jgi:hypothetical protein